MRRCARTVLTVLFVPVMGGLLLGCPKKQTTPEAPLEPKVSESVIATRPGSGADTGTAERGEIPAARGEAPKAPGEQRTEEQRIAQLQASRGEDIPIKESPALEFLEPSAAERAILKPVYFDYDKSVIKAEFQPVLEGIAQWLAKQAGRQLLIEGHCDERGTDEYNLALGERRALAVRRYLIALGIGSDRLHTISYGEEKPAAPGHDESAWSKNRRAEFKVSAP